MSAIDAANKPLEPPTAISLARLRKREGVLDNLGYTFERRMPVILPIVAFVLIMAVWETAIGVMKMVDPLLLSSPSSILKKGWEMFFVTGEIYRHLAVSGQEAGMGFALAIVVGVPMGMLMGRFKTFRMTIEPLVMAKYSIPTIVFLPLFIIWLGIGIWPKVLIIFMGGVFPIMINTEMGVEAADPKLVETARSFKGNERQIMTKITLPAAIPYLIAGIRLAIGRVLITVVVAEFYIAVAGLGFLIMQAGSFFQTSKLFVGAGILGVIGITMNLGLRAAEKKVAPWMFSRQEE